MAASCASGSSTSGEPDCPHMLILLMCPGSGCSPVIVMKRSALHLVGWPPGVVLAEVLAVSVALKVQRMSGPVTAALGWLGGTREPGACTTPATLALWRGY